MHQQFGIPRALRFLSALLLGAAFCVLLTTPAWAQTAHLVNNAPGCNDDADPATPYCTIQAAIDAAAPGDTVQVAAGLYPENITIDKRIKLIGSGSGADPATNTVIERVAASPTKPVIRLLGSGDSETDPLLLANLHIKPKLFRGIDIPGGDNDPSGVGPYTVKYVRFDNIQVVGDATATDEDERCFFVGHISSIEHLYVQNSAFNACDYGWVFNKDITIGDGSYASHITVRNTTFANNSYKGMYFEKLSDAVFDNVVVLNNGPSSFWNSPWNSGIDVNLKAGAYQNLTFRNLVVTGNANGQQHGTGLIIKARDDGTYAANPATLTNVLVEGGLYTGNERGIRIGEPNKNNLGPTNVQIHGAAIYGNIATYSGGDGSAPGDLVNHALAPVNAQGNYWGIASGPGTGAGVITVASGAGAVDAGNHLTGLLFVNNAPGCNDADPATPYCTIQAAITAAAAGDMIRVAPGLYPEAVTLSKHIKLIGSGSGADPATNTVIRRPVTTPRTIELTASGESTTNPLLLEHLRIEPNNGSGINMGGTGAAPVRYIRMNDVQIIGLPTFVEGGPANVEICFRMGTASTVEYLDIQDSAFNDCDQGWYVAAATDGSSYLRHVSVRNSTFRNNAFKGLYVEKLSDTEFINVSVIDNGRQTHSSGQQTNGGIDVNLKYRNDYQNLTFRNLTVTGNGVGYQHGAGLMVKARDDGSYASLSAVLTNVLIEGGLFTGNERGIRFGEPDKGNAGPINVQIHGASLYGNVADYTASDRSATGDLINYSLATIDARGNWWGVAGGPTVSGAGAGLVSAADTSTPGEIYPGTGSILYEPYLTSQLTNKTLEVPSFGLIVPDSQTTLDVPVRFNALAGTEISAIAFTLGYASDPDCLSFHSVTKGNSLETNHQLLPGSGAGEALNIAITYNDGTTAQHPVLSGTLLTVKFNIADGCRSTDPTIQFTFANVSFGTTGGSSVSGTTQGGTIALDFNQQPLDTAFTLSPNSVYEGMPIGAVVGTLSVADPDTWETFTYAFAGGTHDALFTISGDQVLVNGTFDYDTAPILTIKVTATGSGGTEITRELTINVDNYSVLSLPPVSAYVWGQVGGSVAVPVQFAQRSNAVTAAQFTVSYDTTCLSFDGVSDLPTGWERASGETASSFPVSLTGPALTGNVTLAKLNFNVTGSCGTYPTPLNFTAAVLQAGSRPVSAHTSNGVVYVIEHDGPGNCNSDEAVDAGDFSAVVLEHFDDDTGRHTSGHWLEAPRPAFAGSPLGCDANVDQKVDISDLSCTVNVVFNDIACTTSFGLTGASMAATATLVQGQAVASDGALEVPVALESNGNALAAFAFTLRYDPAQYTLDLSDADQDGIPDAVAFNMPANIVRWAISNAGEGKLQLAGAGLQLPLPTLADGTLVTVRLTPTGGADGAGIRVDDASLGSTAGFSVSVVVVGPGGSLDRRIFLPAISQ